MKQAELDAIKGRLERATAGPWRSNSYGEVWAENVVCFTADHPGNAEFIAAARTDIPRLLEEVKRLRGLLSYVASEADVYGFYDCGPNIRKLFAEIREALGEEDG